MKKRAASWPPSSPVFSLEFLEFEEFFQNFDGSPVVLPVLLEQSARLCEALPDELRFLFGKSMPRLEGNHPLLVLVEEHAGDVLRAPADVLAHRGGDGREVAIEPLLPYRAIKVDEYAAVLGAVR